jgi:hypothetical protein
MWPEVPTQDRPYIQSSEFTRLFWQENRVQC